MKIAELLQESGRLIERQITSMRGTNEEKVKSITKELEKNSVEVGGEQ